ncbi:putative lipoprotein [Pseudomonas sp. TE3911]
MMKLNSLGAASLLALTLVMISGCDQVEKSAQQVLGKATESVKQAIDDTHKAAEQALSEATQGLISPQKKDDQEENESDSNSKEA